MRFYTVFKYLAAFFLGVFTTDLVMKNEFQPYPNGSRSAVVVKPDTAASALPSIAHTPTSPIQSTPSDLSEKALDEIKSIIASELNSHLEQQLVIAPDIDQYHMDAEALADSPVQSMIDNIIAKGSFGSLDVQSFNEARDKLSDAEFIHFNKLLSIAVNNDEVVFEDGVVF